jgi:hypothetical protein
MANWMIVCPGASRLGLIQALGRSKKYRESTYPFIHNPPGPSRSP